MPRNQDKDRAGSNRTRAQSDIAALRARLIEEHDLRETVEWHKEIRARHPELWQEIETARHARNQASEALNQALRSAGCSPVALQLSLQQKIEKLRRLRARNRADLASLEQSKSDFPKDRQRHTTRKTSAGRRDDG